MSWLVILPTTQVRTVWKEGTSIKKNVPTRLVCGQAHGGIFLINDSCETIQSIMDNAVLDRWSWVA